MNETKIENTDSEIVDAVELEVIEGESAEDKSVRLETLNKQLFERAKKAEGFVKGDDGKWVKAPVRTETKPTDASKKPDTDNLSQADLITLMRSDIPEEDVADVVEYAKFKGVTVAEALKSNVVKATLAEKKEARAVAEGTSTGSQRRGSGKLSDEALMDNAQKGILPESDEDMERLSILRRKGGKK